MLGVPVIEIADDLGQHYNPFSFTYQLFDNDAGMTVTERIDGNRVKTIICDNKEIVTFEVPRHIWRELDNGQHTFTVQVIDIEGVMQEKTTIFNKVTMPWYGISKILRLKGARKPQTELTDLSNAKVKVLSKKALDKVHAVQDVELGEKYFIKNKLKSGEHLINKASKGGSGINIKNKPLGQIILSKNNIDLSNVKTIKGFECEGNNAFVIFSFDNGVSWNGKFNHETNKYEVVDINNLLDATSKCIDITNELDLNIDRLNQIAESLTIRIGYVLPLATSCINKFKMNATISGVFEKVKDEDYKVEYINDTMVRITFNADGTYKVNYISGELTESEYDELNGAIKDILNDISDIKDNGVKVTLPELDLATDFVPLRYNNELKYDNGKLVGEVYTGDVEKSIEYKYDGKLIVEKIVTDKFGSKKSSYKYDEYNRLIDIVDEGTENSMSAGVIGMPIGHNIKLEYDSKNRVVLEVYSGTVNKRIEYEYIGNHTKKKKVKHQNGEEYMAVYTYDLSGNLIAIVDEGVDKIYTPLNSGAVTKPRTISKVEKNTVLTELTPIISHKELKDNNNFNVIMNSEILIKNEYGEKSDSIVTVIMEQDGIVMEEIHLYPQEVQKYSIGSSEGMKIIAKGRLSYSYSVGVI